MALPACCLPILKTLLGRLAPVAGQKLRALSLGYPDLLASREQLIQIFGAEIAPHLRPREDAEAVGRWHGTTTMLPTIFETVSFFDAIGITIDCVDIHASRGFERVLDLNHKMPADMEGAYHLVLDLGTIEHCFNIAQAMANSASALAEGGCILHLNPLNLYNHGFYNVSPTFYSDFYGQNGFELVFLTGLTGSPTNPAPFDVAPVARFHKAPDNSVLIAVAQRTRVQPIGWPTQQKYLKNPNLRA
jgi:hypothetical protein